MLFEGFCLKWYWNDIEIGLKNSKTPHVLETGAWTSRSALLRLESNIPKAMQAEAQQAIEQVGGEVEEVGRLDIKKEGLVVR